MAPLTINELQRQLLKRPPHARRHAAGVCVKVGPTEVLVLSTDALTWEPETGDLLIDPGALPCCPQCGTAVTDDEEDRDD